MTVARVSHAAVEVLLQPELKGRLGQQAAELLLQGTPRARLGQEAIEVLRSIADTTAANPRRPVLILCVAA